MYVVWKCALAPSLWKKCSPADACWAVVFLGKKFRVKDKRGERSPEVSGAEGDGRGKRRSADQAIGVPGEDQGPQAEACATEVRKQIRGGLF
jgi:hypothetical protein